MFGGENVKCPSCGSENDDTTKFCKNCGERLQGSSSQVSSSQISPKSEPKDNKNLIIGAIVIICAIVVAGAFIALNSSENSGTSYGTNFMASSIDYYQYDFHGYTFNIPSDYQAVDVDFDSETLFNRVGFENDDGDYIYISVRNNIPYLNKDTARDVTGASNGNMVLTEETFANVDGWGSDIENSTITGHMFGFYSGDDIIIIGGSNCDLNKVLENINQEPLPDSPSSSTTETMTYSEASSYLSGASSTVIENTFDEADANGDGVLTGSEINKFKKLADLTERTADTSNSENVEAQDYGAGDGTTKTRYCTTHGRVAVGSDNLCPYCQEEGLDARTVKGSTEYI